ncbi:ACR109Wp [Eremothecium gossypii ATCC 10895]|uniref:ACR109Wp n=1 Tax=Eremothecium gossypii (strain ATCC 10895 / CBS 109.51 / FGSC 9923 / NRRL Y-1056) TaxID=284811 RepID=Q75CE7_EREGS|nr:ACR109Wp [Eremothecium gossypii ATCC 10895]AAS51335.2 ACR109Wp [Eremothecium gossypii ATCC 10895]AEY95627.1 FACR109Wp [Eremothecium gossypii FDAG1]
MSSSDTKSLPFLYQFFAGAVAGVSEILVMYPLDVVKTRMQLQVQGGAGPHYTGVVDCLKKIVAGEGVGRLYKGISSPILMEAPKRATKFACNDEFQKLYKQAFGVEKLSQPLSMLAGASAGCVEAFVVVPFELVKIRLQDASSSYKGPVDVVRKIVAREGVLAMYNGLESTLWRHALWNGGYFGIIFQARALLPAAHNKTQRITNDLIAGSIGGSIGCMLSTPFDVVKSRIQNTAVIPGVVRKYNWSLPSLLTIYREEGFRALYKGFVPKVLRLGPGGGILLVVFTGVLDFCRAIHYGK